MTDIKRTRLGFLATIIAEPDDDVHRLVYSDWLEEQGEDERAEFIRVQIRQSLSPVSLWCVSGVHCYTDGGCFQVQPRRVPQFLRPGDHLESDMALGFLHAVQAIRHGGARENTEISYGPRVRRLPAYGQFEDREADARIYKALVTGKPEWLAYLARKAEWNRGFIHTVRLFTSTWLRHRVRLVTQHPIQRVELTDKEASRYSAEYPVRWRVYPTQPASEDRADLWNALVGPQKRFEISFKSTAAADDWLSSRLIDRAREVAKKEAGL